MKSRRYLSALALAVVTLAACPGEDDDARERLSGGPYELSVLVVDAESGDPLVGMIAYLYDEKKVKERRTTDRDGRAEFGYYAPKRYGVAAGRNALGYVPEVRQFDLEDHTELRLELRKHEGLAIRVEMPRGVPFPRSVKVVYRKAGASTRPMSMIKLDEAGVGHTFAIYPAEYDMTFVLAGYRPVERHVNLRHQGNEPVVVAFVSE